MQFRRSSRRGFVLWVPAAVVVLWLTLVATFELLKPAHDPDATVCIFRTLTGMPCPTCGSTRAALAVACGHPVQAFLFNPFMCIAGAIALTWFVLRVGFARQLSLNLTITGRRAMWAAISAAFLLNWVYMIWRDLR